MARINLIGKDGYLALDKWAAIVEYIGEGFHSVVYPNSGFTHTILDKDMKPIDISVDEHLDEVWNFQGGVAGIRRISDFKRNFIDKEGKPISDQWFVSVFYTGNGIAAVSNNKNNLKTWLVDKKTSRLSDVGWLVGSVDLKKDGWAIVRREKDLARNLINYDGEYLSDEWFKDARIYSEGYSAIQRMSDGKWNFIDGNGKYLSDEWFADADYFSEGYATVQRVSDEKWNFIDKNCRYLCKEWYIDVGSFGKEGYATVQRASDEKWNYIDKNGNILSKEQWFDSALQFRDNIGIVSIGSSDFVVNRDGTVEPM